MRGISKREAVELQYRTRIRTILGDHTGRGRIDENYSLGMTRVCAPHGNVEQLPAGVINQMILQGKTRGRYHCNSLAIHFDVVEVARSRFVRHPSCYGRFPVLIPSGR
jgi:hypothetical protein